MTTTMTKRAPFSEEAFMASDPLVDADSEIEALEESIVGATKVLNDNERPKRLTMQLIRQSIFMTIRHSAKRLLPVEDEGTPEYEGDGDDDREAQEIDALLQKRVLRLDWLSLGRIENLEAFTHVQELYLQHNLIEKIENLEDHQELTFLALGGNRIKVVESIRHLDKLKFLDLSNNCIDDFDIREFPESLRILRLAGNPFIRHMPAYVHLFFERLPNLIQVDQYRRSSSYLDNESTAQVSPISPTSSLTYSPRSQYVEMEMEVELAEKLSTPRSKEVVTEATTMPFDANTYKQERRERMDKWKEQLKELETRKADLERDVPVMTRTTSASSLRARRKLAVERAREATQSAIAESISHFQQLETQHREWQERQQQAA